MAMIAKHWSKYAAFLGNGDISIWVKTFFNKHTIWKCISFKLV